MSPDVQPLIITLLTFPAVGMVLDVQMLDPAHTLWANVFFFATFLV